MAVEHRAYARVTMTVEMDLTQPWGGESTLQEVYKRAAREAVDRLNRLRDKEGDTVFRVLGEVHVKAIIVEEHR